MKNIIFLINLVIFTLCFSQSVLSYSVSSSNVSVDLDCSIYAHPTGGHEIEFTGLSYGNPIDFMLFDKALGGGNLVLSFYSFSPENWRWHYDEEIGTYWQPISTTMYVNILFGIDADDMVNGAYRDIVFKYKLLEAQNWSQITVRVTVDDLSITGAGLVCTSPNSSFTVSGQPSGCTYSWTKSSNLSYVSGSTSSTYTVKAGSPFTSDNGWIEAELNKSTCEWTKRKDVWVGPPIITNKKVDGGYYYPGMQICPGNHYLNVTPVGGDAGTAEWTVPPGITYFVGINELDFTFPSSASRVAITARSTNTCGTGSNSSFYLTKKYYGCGRSYGMTVHPNPADSYVEITFDESKLAEAGLVKDDQSYDFGSNSFFRIIDKFGEVKLTQKYSGEKVTQINTSKLPPGLYTLQLVTSDKVFSTNFMVSR